MPALAALSLLGAPVAAQDGGRSNYSGVYVMDPVQIKAGDLVPPFKARGIAGDEVNFESLVKSGRSVVLAFWSKYCKSCVEKFSALVAMQAKYGPAGLQVVSVNTDGEYREGEKTIKAFLEGIEAQRKIAINFPVIYDEKNRIPGALGISFLPTIVAVDARGRVVEVYHRFDEAGEPEILAGIEALVRRAVTAAVDGAPATQTPPPVAPR